MPCRGYDVDLSNSEDVINDTEVEELENSDPKKIRFDID